MEQNFLECFDFIFKWAGTWSYSRYKGRSRMYGISQYEYDRYRVINKQPKQSVKFISNEDLKNIYFQYWITSDSWKLKFPMALIYFDTVLNEGLEIAKQYLNKSNGDVEEFLKLKQQYLYDLSNKINDDNRIKSWQSKHNDLKQTVGY